MASARSPMLVTASGAMLAAARRSMPSHRITSASSRDTSAHSRTSAAQISSASTPGEPATRLKRGRVATASLQHPTPEFTAGRLARGRATTASLNASPVIKAARPGRLARGRASSAHLPGRPTGRHGHAHRDAHKHGRKPPSRGISPFLASRFGGGRSQRVVADAHGSTRRASGVREPPPERTEETVRAALEASKLAGRRFSARVHRPTIAAGAVLGLAGSVLEIMYNNALGATLLFPGVVVLMLSLLPTDGVRIQRTMFAGALLALALVAAYVWASIVLVEAIAREYPRCSESVFGAHSPTLTLVPCWFEMGSLGTCVGGGLVALLLLVEVVSKLGRPPRVQLDGLWRVLRTLLLCAAALLAVFAVLFHLRFSIEHLWAEMRVALVARYVATAEALLLAALLTPSRRTAMHAWLDSHGEPASVAAGIAALLNARPVNEVHELARSTFHGIRLDLICEEHLRSAAPMPELHACSRHAGFGSVDAFITHSWHDDASEKWEALQAWRAEFVARNHREPVVWLDKACLNPESISDSLPCLPIYLAGCDKLLVLMGPTLLTRLWCVVELFIFLNMGGDRARIELRELASIAPRSWRRRRMPPPPTASAGAARETAVVAPAELYPEPQPEPAPVAHAPAAEAPQRMTSVYPINIAGATDVDDDPTPADSDVASQSELDGEHTQWTLDELLDHFDVMDAGCSLQQDTERLLAVIEASSGGAEAFSERVRHALRGLSRPPTIEYSMSGALRTIRSMRPSGSGAQVTGAADGSVTEAGLIGSFSGASFSRRARSSSRGRSPSPPTKSPTDTADVSPSLSPASRARRASEPPRAEQERSAARRATRASDTLSVASAGRRDKRGSDTGSVSSTQSGAVRPPRMAPPAGDMVVDSMV